MKTIDLIEKVTYSRVARESKDGRYLRKVEEQKKKYPVIYQEWAAIVNDVQKEVLGFHRLTYEFNGFRERFMTGLKDLSKDFTDYITATDRTLMD